VDERDGKESHIVLSEGARGLSSLSERMREPLLALMAGVGVLLLIVCLNVSHLLLARALSRRREMSIRTALGATRARLGRQLLTEGLLLAALGGLGGVLCSGWLTDGLVALTGRNDVEVGADLRVLAFTAVLSLGTALLLGLVPAWEASRGDVQQTLRATAASVTGRSRLLSRILMVGQVALSLVLLVGAGLLAGSLQSLRERDKGFDEEHILTVDLLPKETGLSQPQVVALSDQLIERLRALPGVRAASLSFASGPLQGGGWGEIIQLAGSSGSPGAAPGFFEPRGNGSLGVKLGAVTSGFFETLGLTLLSGRTFEPGDRAGAPRVAVVNQRLARRLFGEAAPLGRHFRFDRQHSPSMPPDEYQVVGVVRDATNNGLRQAPVNMAYFPVAQTKEFASTLDVRATGEPALLAEAVRAAVRATHPGLPVVGVRTMRSQVAKSLWRERLMTVLAAAFGGTALFLVCLGLYGVIGQWAGQRTREIGVRMALGATGGGVRWLVLRQALGLVAAGVLLGIPAALAAARLIEGMLYGVSPLHPPTLAAATLVMLAVATLAAYLPARRASRVDPMTALRSE
jgi:predicted permease